MLDANNVLDEQANADSRRYFVSGAQLLQVSNLTLLENDASWGVEIRMRF